jgi:prevent-host-death family protein
MNSSIAELRSNLAELINRVAYGRERVTLERRGRPVAVLVSLADAKRLARLDAAPNPSAAPNAKATSNAKAAPIPKPPAKPRAATKNQERRTKNRPAQRPHRNTRPEDVTLEALRQLFQNLDPEERPKRIDLGPR